MDQPPRLAPDLAALLLCCGNTALETLARPLRRLMPTFASHPVVQHFGPRLSHCPHLVAGFIERYVAEELERPYGDPQADLAAATLSRNGVTLKDGVTLPEIESAVIDLHAAACSVRIVPGYQDVPDVEIGMVGADTREQGEQGSCRRKALGAMLTTRYLFQHH